MEEVLFQRCLVLLKQPSLINSDLLFSLAAKNQSLIVPAVAELI